MVSTHEKKLMKHRFQLFVVHLPRQTN